MLSRDRQVLDAALAELLRTTGPPATVVEDLPEQGRRNNVVVRIGVENGAQLFAAEVRSVDRFQTPALVKARLANSTHVPLLVAPLHYAGNRGALPCHPTGIRGYRRQRVPSCSRLYVYVVGQRRPATLRRDQFQAMNAAGLRIAFVFLCCPDLVNGTYRIIARAAATSLGAVGAVVRDLEQRGFLRTEPHFRTLVDPKQLLEEWVTHFPIGLRPKLGSRRFGADSAVLRSIDLSKYRAYWSGEPAAEKLGCCPSCPRLPIGRSSIGAMSRDRSSTRTRYLWESWRISGNSPQ
jgi:hypothetical protein